MTIAKEQNLNNTSISAKKYVQENLIYMWDGIENTEFGKHTSNSIPVDLINGIRLDAYGDISFTDNSFKTPDYAFFQCNAPLFRNAINDHCFTMEICMKNDICSNGAIVGIDSRGLWIYSGYKANVETINVLSENYYSGNINPDFKTDKKFTISANLNNRVTSCTINGSNTWFGQIGSLERITDDALRIGEFPYPWSTKHNNEFFNIRIYSSILSQDQILENHRIDKLRFNF